MGERRDRRDAARAARKARLIEQLRQTGNAAEAGRRCGVPLWTVESWRKADRAFADGWHKARTDYEGARIAGLARPGAVPTRFDTQLQREVLDLVAATQSVRAAALTIGMDPQTVWGMAHRDAAFGIALTRAIRHGHLRNEAQLISDCVNGKEPLADETRERVSDAVRAGLVRAGGWWAVGGERRPAGWWRAATDRRRGSSRPIRAGSRCKSCGWPTSRRATH